MCSDPPSSVGDVSVYYIRLVSSLSLASDWEEELELGRQLVLGVEAVREVNSSDSAVSVNLNAQGLNVVGTVGTAGEIGQVELNLIPAFVESHWHCADEGLHTGRGLIV